MRSVTEESDAARQLPAYEVRPARPAECDQVCEVCTEGFAATSEGILTPATIGRQVATYYDPARVRSEIENADATPAWQGYVVAVDPGGAVLGAAGGGVRDGTVGQVYVLYPRISAWGDTTTSSLSSIPASARRERSLRTRLDILSRPSARTSAIAAVCGSA